MPRGRGSFASVFAITLSLLIVLAFCLACEGATLVRRGRPSAVIVIADDAGEGVRSAAAELNYWISRITGTELEVRRQGEWDGRGTVVAVGVSPFTVQRGVSGESLAGEIGREGAKVVIERDYAILAGRDSPLHAVIEFVKHGLGVRWIMPGEAGEVYEPRSTLSVTPRSWTWDTNQPDYRRLRGGSFQMTGRVRGRIAEQMGEEYAEGIWKDVWPQVSEDYSRWLRLQRVDVGRVTIGHAFTHWWDAYGEKHPGWFATLPGGREQRGGRGVKLCVSNPEVAEQVFREWVERFRPAGRDLRIMPNDSRNFCVCENCRAWDAPQMRELSDSELANSDRSIVTDRYVRFWNTVAAKAVEVDPDVRITTYAYRSYEHPPLTGLRVHPNVWVGMVTGEGFYPDEPVRDYWKQWADLGASLYWRPNLMHCGHGMPYVFARSLGEDLKFFQANRMVGVDFDSLTGHWGTQGINYYVAAEMITRPDADVEEVIGEYYTAFGRAEPAVRDYFEYWHGVTLDGPRLLREHNLVSHRTWGGWWQGFVALAPVLYTDEVLKPAEAHLRRAESLAENETEIVKKRLRLLRIGFEHSRLSAAAIGSAFSARRSPGLLQAQALESQRELLSFRRKMFAEYPHAVNVPYLMDKERRRDLMWQVIVDWTAEHLLTDATALSEGWFLRPDFRDEGLKGRWYESKLSASWHPVDTGMPWRRSATGIGDAETVWYRTEFDGPDSDTGEEKVFLRFGSVDAAASIWINGQLAEERKYPHEGDNESWRRPFEIEITRHIIQHQKNTVAVRVHSEQDNCGITGLVSIVVVK